MSNSQVVEIVPNTLRKIILEMSIVWSTIGVLYLIAHFLNLIIPTDLLNRTFFIIAVIYGLIGPCAKYLIESREDCSIQFSPEFVSGPVQRSSSRAVILFNELNKKMPPARSLYDKLCFQTILCKSDRTTKIKICHFAFDKFKREEIFNNIKVRIT
jgi:hypothetical protein